MATTAAAKLLLHSDALAIVASWKEKLHACGAVVLSSKPLVAEMGSFSPIPWIDIILKPLITDICIGNLRDAIDIWHALSRCAGYAAHLNTSFWQGALRVAGVGGDAYDLACVPVLEDGHHFPRFRLHLDHNEFYVSDDANAEATRVEKVLQRFFHRHDDAGSRGSAFTETMAILQPFITSSPLSSHGRDCLQIALALPSMDTQWLLPVMERVAHTLPPDVAIVEVCLNHCRYKPVDPLDGNRWLHCLDDRASGHVPLLFSYWTLDEHIEDKRIYGALYRQLLGIHSTGNAPKIRTLHVDCSCLSESQLATLCSCLPYATTVIHTVRLYKDPDWDWNLLTTRHSWAWLAYALFHRNHGTCSSWRELVLDGCGFQVEDASIVEDIQQHGHSAMRRYLQLEQHQDEAPPTPSMAVELKSGTKIRANPSDAHDLDSGSQPLHIIQSQSRNEFDTLGEAASTAFPNALAIIVPGFGLCWVHTDDVIQRSSDEEPPSPNHASHTIQTSSTCLASRLTGLCARLDRWDYGSIAGLKPFIRSCSSLMMKTIDLSHHEPLSAVDVHEIFSWCPHLECVALNHDGTAWSGPPPQVLSSFVVFPAIQEHYHHLKKLRLCCSLLEAHAVLSSLRRVPHTANTLGIQELFFRVTKGARVFPTISKSLGLLLRKNTTIQAFVMLDESWKTTKDGSVASSDTTRAKVEKALKMMGMAMSPYDHVDVDTRYTLALSCVMQHVAVKCIGSCLPQDVVVALVAFTGGDVKPRNIWIELR